MSVSDNDNDIDLPVSGFRFVQAFRQLGITRYSLQWPDGSLGSDTFNETDARAFSAAMNCQAKRVPDDIVALSKRGADLPFNMKTIDTRLVSYALNRLRDEIAVQEARSPVAPPTASGGAAPSDRAGVERE